MKTTRRNFLKGLAVAVPTGALVPVAGKVAEAEPITLGQFTDPANDFAYPAGKLAGNITGEQLFPGPFDEGDTVDGVTLTVEADRKYGEQKFEGDEVKVRFDYDTKTMTLESRCTLADLYSHIKDHWKYDDTAIRYEFPIIAITPELMEIDGGWGLQNVHMLRNGSLIDDGYGSQWMGQITLGQMCDDEVIQYRQVYKGEVADLWQDFTEKGHINEAIRLQPGAEDLEIRYGGKAERISKYGAFPTSVRHPFPGRIPVSMHYDLEKGKHVATTYS